MAGVRECDLKLVLRLQVFGYEVAAGLSSRSAEVNVLT